MQMLCHRDKPEAAEELDVAHQLGFGPALRLARWHPGHPPHQEQPGIITCYNSSFMQMLCLQNFLYSHNSCYRHRKQRTWNSVGELRTCVMTAWAQLIMNSCKRLKLDQPMKYIVDSQRHTVMRLIMDVRVRFATEIACPEISVRRPFSRCRLTSISISKLAMLTI